MPNSPANNNAAILHARLDNAIRNWSKAYKNVKNARNALREHKAAGRFFYFNRAQAREYKARLKQLEENLNSKLNIKRTATKRYEYAQRRFDDDVHRRLQQFPRKYEARRRQANQKYYKSVTAPPFRNAAMARGPNGNPILVYFPNNN